MERQSEIIQSLSPRQINVTLGIQRKYTSYIHLANGYFGRKTLFFKGTLK